MQKYRPQLVFGALLIAISLFFGVKFFFSSAYVPIHGLSTPVNTDSHVYYVSVSGSDANAGTQAQPWKTIQKAANSGSGTIYVLAGTYPERVKITRAGLTFMAQGVVNMKGFTITANNTTIKGFNISTSVVTDPDGFGIKVSASGCLLEGNYIHDTGRDGVLLDNSTSQCVVRNNTFVHPSQSGVDVRGTNNIIESNDISGTYQHPPQWANPPSWVDADGIHFFGSGHIIRGNYIHDIHYGIPENIDPHIDCFQTWSDSSKGGSGSNILFDRNYCNNPETMDGLAGKAWQIQGDAPNLLIRNNVVHANLIAIISDTRNLTIINNTFAGDPNNQFSQGIYLYNSIDTTIENNIFAYQENGIGSIWPDAISEASLKAGYNCVFRAGGIPWRAQDPGDVWGLNPLFINETTGNYHLKADSPCIDKGMSQVDNPIDFDGTPRPQGAGYDMGAFEFSGQ